MRRYARYTTFTAAVFVCFLGNATGNPYIAVFEDFTSPPNQIDSTVWSTSSFGSGSTRVVDDGQLTMATRGWAHFNAITTIRSDLNFLAREHTVSVVMEGLAEPDWETEPLIEDARDRDGYALDFHRRELYFVIGPASSWNEYVDWDNEYYRWEGFGFSIRWELTSEDPREGSVFLRSDNPDTGIQKLELTGFPSGISFTVNDSAFQFVLDGADFLQTGLNTLSGTHALSNLSQDRLHFMTVLHQYAMDRDVSGQVTFESIVITASAPPPGPVSWAGYDILEDDWVDTGEMLGFLYIGNAPWVFSESMQRWIYLPESHVFSQGAWWATYR